MKNGIHLIGSATQNNHCSFHMVSNNNNKWRGGCGCSQWRDVALLIVSIVILPVRSRNAIQWPAVRQTLPLLHSLYRNFRMRFFVEFLAAVTRFVNLLSRVFDGTIVQFAVSLCYCPLQSSWSHLYNDFFGKSCNALQYLEVSARWPNCILADPKPEPFPSGMTLDDIVKCNI